MRLGHRAVVERLVEHRVLDARLAGDLAQRAARRGGVLDDLARLVVADVRVERGRGREGQLRVVLAVLAVRLDPVDALLGEQPARRSRAARSSRAGCAPSAGRRRSARSGPACRRSRSPASFPITCAATWVTTSGITGLTLPGMIELPFCSSGSEISARPARGPEPRKRRSFAIFVSETATVLSAPEASTRPSRAACASNGSAGAPIVRPVSAESRARTRAANSGCVLRPVPTAVPPSGIWPSRSSVEPTRVEALADLRRVAAELLAERDRHRVHPVRAARLDDVVELGRLRLQRRRRASASAGSRSFVSSSSAARWTADGKTSFDDWPMFTSSFAWTSSPARRRDHLVRVHVRRGARAGLEDVDRELVVELARGDPVAGGGDPLGLVGVEQAELGVHARGGGLDPAEPARDRAPGSARPETGKLSIALRVSPPQSSREASVSLTAGL